LLILFLNNKKLDLNKLLQIGYNYVNNKFGTELIYILTMLSEAIDVDLLANNTSYLDLMGINNIFDSIPCIVNQVHNNLYNILNPAELYSSTDYINYIFYDLHSYLTSNYYIPTDDLESINIIVTDTKNLIPFMENILDFSILDQIIDSIIKITDITNTNILDKYDWYYTIFRIGFSDPDSSFYIITHMDYALYNIIVDCFYGRVSSSIPKTFDFYDSRFSFIQDLWFYERLYCWA